jgi:hypothetical protein
MFWNDNFVLRNYDGRASTLCSRQSRERTSMTAFDQRRRCPIAPDPQHIPNPVR